MKSGPYLTLFTKINSEQIKDLNLRPEIVKLLEGHIGQKLLNIGLDIDFYFFGY